ncbi:MAG: extracellular solute-binding protein [Butyrivibrio sp.]|nr:extracellular solute-binding protein [Butyrivibrio sp.]
MINKKKLISILMVLVMVLSCISCGKVKEELGDEHYPDVDFDQEPITITYLTIGDKPGNGMTEKVVARINELLLKKVNAKLDIYYIGWDDYLNHYNKVLEGNDTELDLIATGTDWLDAWPNVFNGNFLPMSPEMLKTYCPRTYKNVTEEQWEKCSLNGSIYFIPENEYSQWTNHGFIYRSDIAAEAGLDEIHSWADLEQYVNYVLENRPDLITWDSDGSSTVVTLGYLMSMSKYVPIYEISTYGIWGADAENLDKIYSPYYVGDDLLEFARLMKRWNEQGVWKADPLAAEGGYKAFYEGSAALEQHHTQNFYTDIKPTMEHRQTGTDVHFFWFGEDCGNLLRTSFLHGAMAVSSRSKNPEKALMVYDILRNDEECYRLLRYGFEGTQYVINSDGLMEKPSGYNSDRDSIVTNFWWGRRDELELYDASFAWDDYKALVDGYEKVAIDYPWDGIPFAGADVQDKISAVIGVCDRYIPEISFGRYNGSPEDEIESFREALKKAGIEEVTKKLQEFLDTY